MKKVKDIAIFGAGGFGREVACLLRKINAVGLHGILSAFTTMDLKKVRAWTTAKYLAASPI